MSRFLHHRRRIVRPLAAFTATEASGGIVLLAATALALIWANSPWDGRYFDLVHHELGIDFRAFEIRDSFGHLVNDGLMTVFFFVVGLEIKRELVEGELASPRKAALPVAAALGGMVAPALIYTAWNLGGEGVHGWGIPMATDIAFAMGVLALLGGRAPTSLKVFLLALAIVDDLGAILVIAVFYTDSVSWVALGWAAAVLVGVLVVRRAGVQAIWLYVVLGIFLWAAVYKSGIHATIAGVVLASLAPVEGDVGDSVLDRLEAALHPWVSYGIVPLFALVNAGVAVSSGLVGDSLTSPVSLGIATGLVIGKPAGIAAACFVAARLRIAELPSNADYGHLLGLGLVAGIGFTVSLFITNLAFDSARLVDEAKLGILAASTFAGAIGFVYLWFAPGEPAPKRRTTNFEGR